MTVTFSGILSVRKAQFHGETVSSMNGGSRRGLNVALQHFANHSQQIVTILALGNEAVSPRRTDLLASLIRVVNGENYNFGVWRVAKDLTNGNQSVQNRHIDIKNDQVRPQCANLVN